MNTMKMSRYKKFIFTSYEKKYGGNGGSGNGHCMHESSPRPFGRLSRRLGFCLEYEDVWRGN